MLPSMLLGAELHSNHCSPVRVRAVQANSNLQKWLEDDDALERATEAK